MSYEQLKNNLTAKHSRMLELFKQKPDNVYIYGRDNYGKMVLDICHEHGIIPKGFIDGSLYQEKIREQHGYPLFKLSHVKDKDALIIISSLNGVNRMYKRLKENDYKNLLSFLVLFVSEDKYLDRIINFDESLEAYLLDVVENKHEYAKARDIFDDELSKKTFDYLTDLRLNHDFSKTLEYIGDYDKIYFEDGIYKFGENEVFIDGGGYTGDTTQAFIEKTSGKYKKIFLFEPCPETFEKAKENLKNYDSIELIQKGITDKSGTLGFETTYKKRGCHITENGNTQIQTTSIDSIINEPITFLKLDIEGYEKQGLLGAKETIKKYKPTLAISSYHKPRDLWELPQLIKELNPDYKLYLRVYTNSLETVIYTR